MDPNDPRARALIDATDRYQRTLYPAESLHLDPIGVLCAHNVRFFGAFIDGDLAGCAAVKLMPEGYGELKRLYVRPDARGRGIADALMGARERLLVAAGILCARLETGVHQTAALKFFERMGYRRIGPFGDYKADPLSVFMEKRLHPG
jgi:putative acetyltransferase